MKIIQPNKLIPLIKEYILLVDYDLKSKYISNFKKIDPNVDCIILNKPLNLCYLVKGDEIDDFVILYSYNISNNKLTSYYENNES